jgi:FrmR/RcnR family transcriptional regulator, repressor of frmRAB operon
LGHSIREKSRLLARVRRIRGQVEAVERALETASGCAEVLQLIAATRGAMNGLMAEVIEDHIREHVANPAIESDAERAKGADELVEVVRTYLKS